ncbi:hypothetical protein RF11_11917 [Thelohanellus kitauei]|uniref:Uncharacterized protein n=1 Tax=Thelohanellus kitauei TaxID=669202 RepID=A0A0C2N437_THEKT|nr:hypothetical protein RF11_11917 [Thelohanellus kitauei]
MKGNQKESNTDQSLSGSSQPIQVSKNLDSLRSTNFYQSSPQFFVDQYGARRFVDLTAHRQSTNMVDTFFTDVDSSNSNTENPQLVSNLSRYSSKVHNPNIHYQQFLANKRSYYQSQHQIQPNFVMVTQPSFETNAMVQPFYYNQYFYYPHLQHNLYGHQNNQYNYEHPPVHPCYVENNIINPQCALTSINNNIQQSNLHYGISTNRVISNEIFVHGSNLGDVLIPKNPMFDIVSTVPHNVSYTPKSPQLSPGINLNTEFLDFIPNLKRKYRSIRESSKTHSLIKSDQIHADWAQDIPVKITKNDEIGLPPKTTIISRDTSNKLNLTNEEVDARVQAIMDEIGSTCQAYGVSYMDSGLKAQQVTDTFNTETDNFNDSYQNVEIYSLPPLRAFDSANDSFQTIVADNQGPSISQQGRKEEKMEISLKIYKNNS